MKIKCRACESLFDSLPDWRKHSRDVHHGEADFDLVNEDGSRPQRAASKTIIDMPKVTQMLDAGWRVLVFKNRLGTYSAEASHPEIAVMDRTRGRLIEYARDKLEEMKSEMPDPTEHVDSFHFDGEHLLTDDFTPEQALTRLAYKAHGEIL